MAQYCMDAEAKRLIAAVIEEFFAENAKNSSKLTLVELCNVLTKVPAFQRERARVGGGKKRKKASAILQTYFSDIVAISGNKVSLKATKQPAAHKQSDQISPTSVKQSVNIAAMPEKQKIAHTASPAVTPTISTNVDIFSNLSFQENMSLLALANALSPLWNNEIERIFQQLSDGIIGATNYAQAIEILQIIQSYLMAETFQNGNAKKALENTPLNEIAARSKKNLYNSVLNEVSEIANALFADVCQTIKDTIPFVLDLPIIINAKKTLGVLSALPKSLTSLEMLSESIHRSQVFAAWLSGTCCDTASSETISILEQFGLSTPFMWQGLYGFWAKNDCDAHASYLANKDQLKRLYCRLAKDAETISIDHPDIEELLMQLRKDNPEWDFKENGILFAAEEEREELIPLEKAEHDIALNDADIEFSMVKGERIQMEEYGCVPVQKGNVLAGTISAWWYSEDEGLSPCGMIIAFDGQKGSGVLHCNPSAINTTMNMVEYQIDDGGNEVLILHLGDKVRCIVKSVNDVMGQIEVKVIGIDKENLPPPLTNAEQVEEPVDLGWEKTSYIDGLDDEGMLHF